MDAQRIIQKAIDASGCDDVETGDLQLALVHLIDALKREAGLSYIGKKMVQVDLSRMCKNYLQVSQHFNQKVKSQSPSPSTPIFIVGMPRTGSSFLHNLLASDPQFRAPLYWESLYPYPPPRQDHTDRKRISKAKMDLGFFHLLAPSYRKIYMYGAEKAAECIALMAMSFESQRFGFTYHIPTYWSWIQNTRLENGYQFLHDSLEYLSASTPTKWLLKAPAHVMFLDTLLKKFPKAQLIFTHRHPLKAVTSIASNTHVLRKVFSSTSDPFKVGNEELKRWSRGWDHARLIRRSPSLPETQFQDILYDDLISDPMTTVQSIYQKLNIPWSQKTEERMSHFLQANQQGKFGKHAYTPADFNLNDEIVSEHFHSYIDEFRL